MSTTTKVDPREEEPLVKPAAVTAVLAPLVGLLVAFGLPLTQVQQAAVLALGAAAAPYVVAAWGRRRAYSPATVVRMLGHRASEAPPVAARAVAAPAPQVVAEDPRWLRRYWPVGLALAGLAFVGPEAFAIVHGGDGGTLSEWTRDQLGTSEGAATAGWWTLTAALAGFAVWFPVHLRRGWPWERDDRPIRG